MKANQIEAGRKYIAKVNGKLTEVRVDAIRDSEWLTRPNQKYYDVTNLATGRHITFCSAAKFRCTVRTMSTPDERLEARLRANYDASRFGSLTPEDAEAQFNLILENEKALRAAIGGAPYTMFADVLP
jgi:hypothetical protein